MLILDRFEQLIKMLILMQKLAQNKANKNHNNSHKINEIFFLKKRTYYRPGDHKS